MINPISHIEYIWNEKNYFIMKNELKGWLAFAGYMAIIYFAIEVTL